ncbi:MAG TPA: MBL fold metallo-hydrolase [Saprospiraceae bacterium]|nr:MBL fold metallo-hydrolase [Saprospiraceae bacterium]
MNIHCFTFNDFSENTYILWDETGECIIVDPGCHNTYEREEFIDFIDVMKLNPVILVNTHCHIDHVLGNRFVSEKYQLNLQAHRLEEAVLKSCLQISHMYGIPYDPSPSIGVYLRENDVISFGKSNLSILFTPGHSPGSICLHHSEKHMLIGGDVLFYNSIGRTDLPGGDYNTLMASIRDKIFTLKDHTVVYPGHGPKTTVGYEKAYNPFFH